MRTHIRHILVTTTHNVRTKQEHTPLTAFLSCFHVSNSFPFVCFCVVFSLFPSVGVSLAIIKPDAVKKGHDDAIIKRITDAGFELIARKKLQLTMTQIRTLYLADVAKPFFKAASEFLASGPVICLALRKNAAITDLQNLVGPDNPKLAKKSHPSSIRAQFGTDVNRNAIHCPTSTASNAREVGLIFGEFNFDLLG